MSLLLASVTVYLFQARTEPVKEKPGQGEESQEGVRLKDIHYVQEDPTHKVRWTLDASEATLSKDQQFVTFMNFQVTLKPEDKSAVTMQGKQGEFDKRTGQLVLQGDLTGETEDGYRFATEQVVYHHKEGYMETDKAVRMSGAFFSVEGKGLFLDVAKEKLQILSDTTTLIYGRPPIL